MIVEATQVVVLEIGAHRQLSPQNTQQLQHYALLIALVTYYSTRKSMSKVFGGITKRIDRPTAMSVGLTYHPFIIIKINDFGLEMYVWFFNCYRFEFNI